MADVLTDIMQAVGATNAQNAQLEEIDKATALQQSQYAQNQSNLQPWMQAGQQSLGQLMQGMQSGAYSTNVNPQTVQNDPGYQFRMQQAQQALQRSAAAGGRLNSGAFMKGLDQYSQGLASQEYQNAWQRQYAQNQQNYNNLYQLSGSGQNAAAGQNALGTNYANSLSSLYGARGNARAAGQTAIYGAVGDAWGDIDQAVMSAAGGGGAMGAGQALGGGKGQNASPIPTQSNNGLGGISASSNYEANPGNYSLGNYGLGDMGGGF